MKYIKRMITKINNWKREAAESGICDFSGQGRDKYGE